VRGVLLLDQAALELHRRRQLGGVGQPFVGEDRETLDLLDARQPRVGAVDAGLHLRPQRGIALVSRSNGGVDHDQRDVVGPPVADCARLSDQRAALLEAGLNVGRGHVFPRGVDDQFLLAVDDRQVSVGPETGDVAGVQPAVVVDGRRGGFGQVAITRHHQRSAHEQLPVTFDAHLRAGQWRSNGAGADIADTRQRHHARGFREPVNLAQLNAESGEEIDQPGRTRRSPGERRLELTKTQPAPDLRGVDPGGDVGGDGGLQLFPQPRRGEEQLRTHPRQHRRDGARIGAADHAETHCHRQIMGAGPLGDVGHRQVGDRAVLRRGPDEIGHLGGHRDDVVVSELNAFRRPGGARGVDQRGQVLWAGRTGMPDLL
jgi:hypothetical protein